MYIHVEGQTVKGNCTSLPRKRFSRVQPDGTRYSRPNTFEFVPSSPSWSNLCNSTVRQFEILSDTEYIVANLLKLRKRMTVLNIFRSNITQYKTRYNENKLFREKNFFLINNVTNNLEFEKSITRRSITILIIIMTTVICM